MKKKVVLLFVLSVLMGTILSACGSNTVKTADPSSSTAPAKTNQADTSGKDTKATASATGNVEDIKVEAKDFEYDKKEIHVKKGDNIRITLQSDDGGHGFAIPAFNVNIQGNKSAEFIADKTGTFEYHCSVVCGAGHSKMTGKLVVE